MTKKLNIQLVIIVFLFAAIFAFLGFFVFKPRYETLKNRSQQLSNNQAKLSALTAKKEALLKLKRDQKRIEDNLKRAQDLLPKDKKTSEFLVQVEAGVIETGATVKSIKFPEQKTETKTETTETAGKEATQKTGTAKKSYQTISFQLGTTGDYKQLVALIDLLENLSRLNLLTGLTLTLAQNDLIDTKLDGEIYFK